MPYELNKMFDEKECPECGKSFFKPVETIYKTNYKRSGLKYYCSYTCWMKAVRRHELHEA